MKEAVMRVVLKVWSSNPDYKRRMRLCGCGNREQKALDPSLYERYYWDSSPEYFSPSLSVASQPGELLKSSVELEELLEKLEVDRREVVIAPADFQVPESQIVAVECPQMIVRDGNVAFTALLRHTDIYLTTAEIQKDVIASALASAA
jgi:hypothetical protein